MPEDAPKAQTPVEARDAFVLYVLSLPDADRIMELADKLLDLVQKPHMLSAFALANAELAALHYEDQLSVPEIVVSK